MVNAAAPIRNFIESPSAICFLFDIVLNTCTAAKSFQSSEKSCTTSLYGNRYVQLKFYPSAIAIRIDRKQAWIGTALVCPTSCEIVEGISRHPLTSRTAICSNLRQAHRLLEMEIGCMSPNLITLIRVLLAFVTIALF